MEFINLQTKNTYRDSNNGSIHVLGSESNADDKVFEDIGKGTAMLLLAAGLFVNIVLIIAIRRSPRLKAPIFQILFSLAFADSILLLAYSLPEMGQLLNGGKWAFGSKGCTLLLYIRFLPAHVTNCLIVVCCWERFYAVCRPHSAIWITSRRMSGIIAIVWLLNAGVLAPLVVMTKPVDLIYDVERVTVSACELTMAADVKKLYFTIMGMLFYGITAIVSAIFLGCTICKIKNVDLDSYFIKDDFKNHVLRCIAVITGVSIISWIPHYYAYFYNLHTSRDTHVDGAVVVLAVILVLVSGVVKPILYVSLSSQFRKAVFRALNCCQSDEIDYEQTHGYQMHDRRVHGYRLNDRRLLAESEPL